MEEGRQGTGILFSHAYSFEYVEHTDAMFAKVDHAMLGGPGTAGRSRRGGGGDAGQHPGSNNTGIHQLGSLWDGQEGDGTKPDGTFGGAGVDRHAVPAERRCLVRLLDLRSSTKQTGTRG